MSPCGGVKMAFVSWNAVLQHALVLLELGVFVTGCNGAEYRHTHTNRGVFVCMCQGLNYSSHCASHFCPFSPHPVNTQNTHIHMHTVTDG